jgi:hypothetical protein
MDACAHIRIRRRERDRSVYDVAYRASRGGTHAIAVLLGEAHIGGSPFSVAVHGGADATRSDAPQSHEEVRADAPLDGSCRSGACADEACAAERAAVGESARAMTAISEAAQRGSRAAEARSADPMRRLDAERDHGPSSGAARSASPPARARSSDDELATHADPPYSGRDREGPAEAGPAPVHFEPREFMRTASGLEVTSVVFRVVGLDSGASCRPTLRVAADGAAAFLKHWWTGDGDVEVELTPAIVRGRLAVSIGMVRRSYRRSMAAHLALPCEYSSTHACGREPSPTHWARCRYR